jgi:hypothetical protein
VSFARSLSGRDPSENQVVVAVEVEAVPAQEEETNICNLPPMNPSPIQCTGKGSIYIEKKSMAFLKSQNK